MVFRRYRLHTAILSIAFRALAFRPEKIETCSNTIDLDSNHSIVFLTAVPLRVKEEGLKTSLF